MNKTLLPEADTLFATLKHTKICTKNVNTTAIVKATINTAKTTKMNTL